MGKMCIRDRDYIGFMFFPKSKRHISFERARELAEQLSPEIKKVGVFVNADLREMTEASKILDLIQLHGQESEGTIEILKEKTHLPIIRAVSMTEEKDPFRFNHSGADYLLLDSGKGGTGELFDHRKIKGFEKPFFLAGGLKMCIRDRYYLSEAFQYGIRRSGYGNDPCSTG